MSESILASTKKVLGIEADYLVFDEDIKMHINSVFGTLNQLGLGPDAGFSITDDSAVWSDFLGNDSRLNPVRTYVYLRVRLLFDPPQTGYLVQSMNEQLRELEWRLNTKREDDSWTDPELETGEDDILDGGTP